LAQDLLPQVTPTETPKKHMKINIIPTNKLVMLSAVVCAVMLAFSQNASALGFFPDPHSLGTISPDAPASEADEASYINFMISLAPGGSGTFNGNNITRSTNVFANLPTATDVGAVRDESGSGVVDLGPTAGVYTYLLAKYDGQNDLSQVWYVGDLSGVITIPENGPNGQGLSHWTLFRGEGVVVPDGGTTVMLLGAALSVLGMGRRFLKS
jgi:hypothetical protein